MLSTKLSICHFHKSSSSCGRQLQRSRDICNICNFEFHNLFEGLIIRNRNNFIIIMSHSWEKFKFKLKFKKRNETISSIRYWRSRDKINTFQITLYLDFSIKSETRIRTSVPFLLHTMESLHFVNGAQIRTLISVLRAKNHDLNKNITIKAQ